MGWESKDPSEAVEMEGGVDKGKDSLEQPDEPELQSQRNSFPFRWHLALSLVDQRQVVRMKELVGYQKLPMQDIKVETSI